jgi:hypothetical protein
MLALGTAGYLTKSPAMAQAGKDTTTRHTINLDERTHHERHVGHHQDLHRQRQRQLTYG